jgi:pyrimidine-nucleoside phosphorylase
MTTPDTVETIAAKRDGLALSADAIAGMVRGMVDGSVPDYQAAAFLMAVTLRGMNDGETAALLDAVLASGQNLDFRSVKGFRADKHSTGGVGDKVSLVLAPLAAACGLKVPMISGRGLGHTGGTLDKLESIPGFRVDLDEEELRGILDRVGCFISGQTERLVPADRVMYALRDVTGTVPSTPLILASIVSKKIAEGAEALLFDVKAGAGSVLKSTEAARDLAERLVRLCEGRGLRAGAFVTGMDQPLGFAVGNALEVTESVRVLQGEGPQDVKNLVVALVARLLRFSGVEEAAARAEASSALSSGAAYGKFLAMVEAQGGDAAILEKGLPAARCVIPVKSPSAGYLSALDAGLIGRAAVQLGAGRRTREAKIDAAAGIVCLKKIGDRLKKGEPFALLHCQSEEKAAGTQALVLGAARVAKQAPAPAPLIRWRI